MAERPYTLLGYGMSMDGYLDNASDDRLLLSNDADFDRVDAVRASCDAILVGASIRPQGQPASLRPGSGPHRDANRQQAIADTGQGDGHELRWPRPGRALLHDRRLREARLLRPRGVCGHPAAAGVRRHGGRRGATTWTCTRLVEDLHERGVRRLMVEGGGSVNTQFLTRDRRRAPAGRRRRSSWATREARPLRRRRGVPPGIRSDGRRWRRLGASATSSSCATRSRRASGRVGVR